MFEKEAEEYADGIYHYKINVSDYGEEGKINYRYSDVKEAYQKGAEFGYNKANEWHYVKDGDLPSDFGNYIVCFYGAKGSFANGKPCWEELCFDAETLRWVDRDTFEDLPYVNKEGIVIAWKEIVLPKESE